MPMLLMGGTRSASRWDHGLNPLTANGSADRSTTVRVLNNLFSPHLTNLQSALGKATQRQSLLTNNLANVNTPGYKRQDVDFDIVLAQEMGGMNPALGSEGAAQLSAQQKEATRSNGTSMRVDGNNVDLEREVFALAETELRYQALTDMTASYFQGLKSAIREGR